MSNYRELQKQLEATKELQQLFELVVGKVEEIQQLCSNRFHLIVNGRIPPGKVTTYENYIVNPFVNGLSKSVSTFENSCRTLQKDIKDLEEAITWYRILIYSGYNNHERDPRIKAMFSIIAKYIAENAPSEQKRKLMTEFIREGLH